jgi:hypothetical protein
MWRHALVLLFFVTSSRAERFCGLSETAACTDRGHECKDKVSDAVFATLNLLPTVPQADCVINEDCFACSPAAPTPTPELEEYTGGDVSDGEEDPHHGRYPTPIITMPNEDAPAPTPIPPQEELRRRRL